MVDKIAEWRANLHEIEDILASNPTDPDALVRRETTIAYIAFLEEEESRKEQDMEETAVQPPPCTGPLVVPSEINVCQMMQLFTIASTMRAISIPSHDEENTVQAEAKRRCIQNLSAELMALLEQIATDDDKIAFAGYLQSNGFVSILDIGMAKFTRQQNELIKLLAVEGNIAVKHSCVFNRTPSMWTTSKNFSMLRQIRRKAKRLVSFTKACVAQCWPEEKNISSQISPTI